VQISTNGFFAAPGPARLAALLFTPYRGFFIFMPIAVAALPTVGVYLARRSAAGRALRDDLNSRGVGTLEVAVVGGVFAACLIFNLAYNLWAAGGSWGPRYLLPAVPFAMLLAAAGFRFVRPAPLLWGLVWVSVLINAMGSTNISLGRGLVDHARYFFLDPERQPKTMLTTFFMEPLHLPKFMTGLNISLMGIAIGCCAIGVFLLAERAAWKKDR
jgi:hypothetical protein